MDIPLLTRFVVKSPSFDKSYGTRNILTRFVVKSPSFGKSYSTRKIQPLAPPERLSKVSSPYMVFIC